MMRNSNMYKRLDKSNGSECDIPAKRPRYNAQNPPSGFTPNQKKNPASNTNEKSEDIWGCDFGEEDLQEMDFIASQVSMQDNICSQRAAVQPSQANHRQNIQNEPSTSKGGFNVNKGVPFQASLQSHHFHTEKEGLPSTNNISMVSTVDDYRDFEKKLFVNNAHNSTFQVNAIATHESESLMQELEKLRADHKKLTIDFITKDGEATFLRHQLQQAQLRNESIQSEKSRIIEEKTSQHKNEISIMSKEQEALKTQLDMKALEIGNLMERCKLLEGGQVKLTEPHVVNANFLINKTKFNTSINRTPTTPRHTRLQDNSVQTNPCPKLNNVLNISSLYYPLESIPETIHDLTHAEERIVDFHNIGKAGQRGSPMLHEQISHKVFETPELLRPVTTRIGDRDLTVQFILQDIASLRAKTESELESENCIHMINKIVSTARELLLNLTVALQTISRTIRSDELRDHSELYSDIGVGAKCLCDAKPWHSSEKGIELRRVLGVLSYVSLASSYLSKYIAGKVGLCTHRDESYKQYSEQMTRYCTWSKKGGKFEILEMFSDFVSLVGAVRRSHQFSSVICAIAMILYNVHKTVGYCDTGLQYVLKIFREMILLKPLPYSYAQLGKVMTIFLSNSTHLRSLCDQSSCTFQNFVTQLQKHQRNPITRIDLVDSLLRVVECLLHQNVVPLRIGRSDNCNHCFELVRFLIQNLEKIAEKNLQFVESIRDSDTRANGEKTYYLKPICSKHCSPCLEPNAKCLWDVYREKYNNVNFWRSVRTNQFRVLNAGLVFLSQLAICDPNVESQGPEIENSLHLFMRNRSVFEGSDDHRNERETIARIKETFMADKPIRMEVQRNSKTPRRIYPNNKNSEVVSIMKDRCVQPTNQQTNRRTDHDRSLAAITKLLPK